MDICRCRIHKPSPDKRLQDISDSRQRHAEKSPENHPRRPAEVTLQEPVHFRETGRVVLFVWLGHKTIKFLEKKPGMIFRAVAHPVKKFL